MPDNWAVKQIFNWKLRGRRSWGRHKKCWWIVTLCWSPHSRSQGTLQQLADNEVYSRKLPKTEVSGGIVNGGINGWNQLTWPDSLGGFISASIPCLMSSSRTTVLPYLLLFLLRTSHWANSDRLLLLVAETSIDGVRHLAVGSDGCRSHPLLIIASA